MRSAGGGPVAALEVHAAAKVNLGWRVGGLRADGYHEVEGLMQTISLRDTISVALLGQHDHRSDELICEVDGAPVVLSVGGPEASDDLRGCSNLVVAAARVMAERVPARPTRIALSKYIPSGAGLGGGSADAAGVLTALSLLWSARLSARDLVGLSAQVSSDTPAILLGGLVHASGRGERVRRIGSATGTRLVLGIGSGRLSTPAVYGRLDELRAAGAAAGPGAGWHNDLQDAAASMDPAVSEGVEAMRDAGAVAAFVSGSGPTVVGVAHDDTAATRIAASAGPAFRRVEVCRGLQWGVRIIPASGSRPHTQTSGPQPQT